MLASTVTLMMTIPGLVVDIDDFPSYWVVEGNGVDIFGKGIAIKIYTDHHNVMYKWTDLNLIAFRLQCL